MRRERRVRFWTRVNGAAENSMVVTRPVLLDAAELVSSSRKRETGSDRFGVVLLRIRMHFGLRLWRVLRVAYALHAPSCASDCDTPSFYRLPVARPAWRETLWPQRREKMEFVQSVPAAPSGQRYRCQRLLRLRQGKRAGQQSHASESLPVANNPRHQSLIRSWSLLCLLSADSETYARTGKIKGPPLGRPSNALIFFLLVPSWLVSSVISYCAGPDVDHADSRQQRSRLNLDYQRGLQHPLR